MASRHPELEAEQAYVDLAHTYLDAARERAAATVVAFRTGPGGTEQARFELEAVLDSALHRLTQLDIGDRSLVFGRVDLAGRGIDLSGGERFYIGRVGLWDADSNPIVVDWRAPIAEPFYRATGRQPLGLQRRRHFVSRGQTVLSIEDEFFSDPIHLPEAPDADSGGHRLTGTEHVSRLRGPGVLAAALQAPRTGRLSDIAATIQHEQDEIIRASLPGVLLVQGGPGTGKTVVALHRASYLLYTHRFPLDSQGVLVIGPNRLFLAYIEQVLPSLGEAGVELAVLADLLQPEVRVTRLESEDASQIKGDPRMLRLLQKAVRDRQRPLRRGIAVGYGLQKLRISVKQSARMVADARRRIRNHNAGRPLLEQAFFAALADDAAEPVDPAVIRERTSRQLAVQEALEWMWPVLSPAQLLNDLFGSKALLRSAAAGWLGVDEINLLWRPRQRRVGKVAWSFQDVALLDEARVLLGPLPGHDEDDEDTALTFGHIVVDEAQDLSPMQLRMIARRSLNGSMTVVGDIAQATGAWAHDDWDSVLERLPQKRPHRQVELTVGYRIPAPAMAMANHVLPYAAPGATPPTTVRSDGDEPRIVGCDSGPGQSDLAETLANVIAAEREAVGQGNVAVIVPASLLAEVRTGLHEREVSFGGPGRSGLNRQVTLVPVRLVKGLEVDAAVVVEPARIISEERCGIRSLYVALTRATKRVTVVHAEALPSMLASWTAARSSSEASTSTW